MAFTCDLRNYSCFRSTTNFVYQRHFRSYDWTAPNGKHERYQNLELFLDYLFCYPDDCGHRNYKKSQSYYNLISYIHLHVNSLIRLIPIIIHERHQKGKSKRLKWKQTICPRLNKFDIYYRIRKVHTHKV